MTDKEATETKPDKEAAPATVADLKKLCHDYHVPMSNGTLEEIAENGLDSPKVKAFEEYLKLVASGMYPTLAKMIGAGFKTAHLIEPYRQVAKQMLGEDAEPDFQTDPKATAALSGGIDPETGHPAPMSIEQWKTHIKSDPAFGWQHTPAAHEQSQKIIAALHDGMTAPHEGEQ